MAPHARNITVMSTDSSGSESSADVKAASPGFHYTPSSYLARTRQENRPWSKHSKSNVISSNDSGDDEDSIEGVWQVKQARQNKIVKRSTHQEFQTRVQQKKQAYRAKLMAKNADASADANVDDDDDADIVDAVADPDHVDYAMHMERKLTYHRAGGVKAKPQKPNTAPETNGKVEEPALDPSETVGRSDIPSSAPAASANPNTASSAARCISPVASLRQTTTADVAAVSDPSPPGRRAAAASASLAESTCPRRTVRDTSPIASRATASLAAMTLPSINRAPSPAEACAIQSGSPARSSATRQTMARAIQISSPKPTRKPTAVISPLSPEQDHSPPRIVLKTFIPPVIEKPPVAATTFRPIQDSSSSSSSCNSSSSSNSSDDSKSSSTSQHQPISSAQAREARNKRLSHASRMSATTTTTTTSTLATTTAASVSSSVRTARRPGARRTSASSKDDSECSSSAGSLTCSTARSRSVQRPTAESEIGDGKECPDGEIKEVDPKSIRRIRAQRIRSRLEADYDEQARLDALRERTRDLQHMQVEEEEEKHTEVPVVDDKQARWEEAHVKEEEERHRQAETARLERIKEERLREEQEAMARRRRQLAKQQELEQLQRQSLPPWPAASTPATLVVPLTNEAGSDAVSRKLSEINVTTRESRKEKKRSTPKANCDASDNRRSKDCVVDKCNTKEEKELDDGSNCDNSADSIPPTPVKKPLRRQRRRHRDASVGASTATSTSRRNKAGKRSPPPPTTTTDAYEEMMQDAELFQWSIMEEFGAYVKDSTVFTAVCGSCLVGSEKKADDDDSEDDDIRNTAVIRKALKSKSASSPLKTKEPVLRAHV